MTTLKKFIKTKYLIRAVCLVLCSALFCAFIPACSKETQSDKCTLVIATDDDTQPHLEYVIDEFNKQSDKYEIVMQSYASTGIKKYYLRSGIVQADMVTFVDYSDAAAFTDILQPLNLFKATGNYQSSMINNMRLADDNIYSLPSPGFLYSLCYNTDALESFGYSDPPGTYIAATKLSEEEHNEGYAFCASLTTDEGLVNTLMAISTPTYVTTTKGVAFLKSCYTNEAHLTDEAYSGDWANVLQSFKDLYTTSYFSETSAGATDFVSGNSYAFYYCHDGSLQIALEKAEENGEDVPEYKFYPFVSSQDGRTSIITNPYYYISVTKSAYQDEVKKEGINEFLNYYTSSEGQYAAEKQKDGTLLEGCISFITDYDRQDEQFTGRYEPLKDTFESGRVFFADYFSCVFEGVGSILRSYLSGGINDMDELLATLDEAIAANRSADSETYDIAETYEYDEQKVTSGETEIGNLAADAMRIASPYKVVAVFLPASCINASLLKGSVTANELAYVFTDTTLVRFRVTGAVLKQIALDNVETLSEQAEGSSPAGEAPPEADTSPGGEIPEGDPPADSSSTDEGGTLAEGNTPPEGDSIGETPDSEPYPTTTKSEFLLMSGLYVKDGTVTFSANQKISDEKYYWVALPESVIEKYNLTTDSTTTISLISCLKTYLSSYSPTPVLNGRYGI